MSEVKPISFDEALKWFKSQSLEEQFRLITQAFKDPNSLPQDDWYKLAIIISETMYLATTLNQEDVVNQLAQQDIDENIASLLVRNTSKLKPSPIMDSRVLIEMNLERFIDVVNGILVGYYQKGKTIDSLSKEIGIERGAVDATRRFILSDVFSYLRGQRPIEEIEAHWKSFGVPDERIKLYIKTFQENIKAIREFLVFQAVAKFMSDFDGIKQSLDTMWKTIEDLANAVKKSKTTTDADMYH